MNTSKLPDDAPEWKACPDCYAEGRDPYMLRVADHFYIKRAPRYKGGYRISTYCKEHEKRRIAASSAKTVADLRAKEHETGVTPPKLARLREKWRQNWHARSPEARREQQREWRRTHREVDREKQGRWARSHREYEQARKKKWYIANRERILEQHREYYLANRERILAQQREYRRGAASGIIGRGRRRKRVWKIDVER